MATARAHAFRFFLARAPIYVVRPIMTAANLHHRVDRTDFFIRHKLKSSTELPTTLAYEILQPLDAKESGVVSCVSTLLNSLASDHHGRMDFYCERWDMEEGLSIAVSRSLGRTIRAIAADSELSVAAGAEAFRQCRRAIEGHPRLFDIAASTNHDSNFRLWGHEGPVTSLALDSTRIHSGAWDTSVHIWDRAHLKCSRSSTHGDWVWSLAPRGGTVASTSGGDVYVWDTDNGCFSTIIHDAHVGNAYASTRNHLRDLLFTGGGEDGAIRLCMVCDHCDDDDIKPAAMSMPHTGPVIRFLLSFRGSCLASIDVQKLIK